MSHLGERFEVTHIAGRIADGLAEYRAGILIDQGFEIGGAGRIEKGITTAFWSNS